MKKNNFLFITVIASLVFSCKKEATIKLPKQEPKLVVTCFISPGDTIISAIVGISVGKFTSTYQSGNNITDASIVLSDGTNSIALAYDYTKEAYAASQSVFHISSGVTYFLSVSTPDGKHTEASTTVPSGQIPIKSVNTTLKNYQKIQPQGGGGTYYISFDYDLSVVAGDIPNQPTYLELYFQNVVVSQPDYLPANYPDTLYSETDSKYFDTDVPASKSVYSYKYSNQIFNEDSLVSASVNVIALNCSPEFYHYNETVQRAQDAEDNPFAEPVFVYTNMSNGFGCFGAYVGNYQLKKLK